METKIKQHGQYVTMKSEDFELQNPVEVFINHVMDMSLGMGLPFLLKNAMMLAEKNELFRNSDKAQLGRLLEHKIVEKLTQDTWKDYIKIKNTPFPEELKRLVNTSKKSEQEKLLKDISLTSNTLMSFIFWAHETDGYIYSMYTTEHHHNGLDESQLPTFIHREDDGTIIKGSPTVLNDGQLKNVIDHRIMNFAKFIDLGNNWHCFLYTMDGMTGKEQKGNVPPHIHYISDKWTIPRHVVVNQIKSRRYNFGSLPHIWYTRHPNKE